MPALKQLHFIAPYVPYPANFGGAIDVFHRIVALKELGIRIHLHCFEYDRSQAKDLERYCEKVYYYKRDMRWKKFFSRTPYIVNSRENKILTQRLKKNPFPVLYEGLHSTSSFANPTITQKKFIRTHNVEADYFRYLAKNETSLLRKTLYFLEYLKISVYEKNVANADAVFALTVNDKKHFSTFCNSYMIRAFHSNAHINSNSGKGKYAIYHGNLTISENKNAVRFLLNEVFSKIKFPLTIAGKIVDQKLVKEIKSYSHVTLIANPNQHEMDELIQNAQLVLLPTFQDTGIKLKLLESLFKGRFCIANNKMIDNTELESYCILANTPKEWVEIIQLYKNTHFPPEIITKRKTIPELFNNLSEAQKMIDIMFTA